jgi:hypothetical protein
MGHAFQRSYKIKHVFKMSNKNEHVFQRQGLGRIFCHKCVSHNVTIIGLTICFFMIHNPYKSKNGYLSILRLARSLTNQSCGSLLIWNGPLQIWNGTLFSKMAPWCGQVRGHSLFDKKFFPIPAFGRHVHFCLTFYSTRK